MEQIPDRELIREAMRRLALSRQQVPHVCAECGTAFQGLKRRRYCSVTCKNRVMSRAWRQRQAARAHESPLPAAP